MRGAPAGLASLHNIDRRTAGLPVLQLWFQSTDGMVDVIRNRWSKRLLPRSESRQLHLGDTAVQWSALEVCHLPDHGEGRLPFAIEVHRRVDGGGIDVPFESELCDSVGPLVKGRPAPGKRRPGLQA